jgi:hypothetical protein
MEVLYVVKETGNILLLVNHAGSPPKRTINQKQKTINSHQIVTQKASIITHDS